MFCLSFIEEFVSAKKKKPRDLDYVVFKMAHFEKMCKTCLLKEQILRNNPPTTPHEEKLLKFIQKRSLKR